MTVQRLALFAPLLLLAGCARGCSVSPAAPTLTIAATTTASIVVTHPGAPWRAALVAAEPGAGAPTLAPDATYPEAWSCRWQTPDGTHDMRLRASAIALQHEAPRASGALFFTQGATGGLLLLPYGRVLSYEGATAPPVETTRWHGELDPGALEVVTWRAGGDHACVVLRDGAPLDHGALGGSLSTSSTGGAAGLERLEVRSPSLTFVLVWPDPAAAEVSTTIQLEGRVVPVTFRRLAPGERPSPPG